MVSTSTRHGRTAEPAQDRPLSRPVRSRLHFGCAGSSERPQDQYDLAGRHRPAPRAPDFDHLHEFLREDRGIEAERFPAMRALVDALGAADGVGARQLDCAGREVARSAQVYRADGEQEALAVPEKDSYQAEIEYFIDCCAKGKQPDFCPPREAVCFQNPLTRKPDLDHILAFTPPRGRGTVQKIDRDEFARLKRIMLRKNPAQAGALRKLLGAG